MKTEFKKILTENAEEYYQNAIEAEIKKQYNSAVTLFFKAISSLCDLYIITKEDFMPTSHTERFRILQTKYSNIYRIIDKDFSFYQDSYKARLNKETSNMLKEDVKKLFKILSINIKKI